MGEEFVFLHREVTGNGLDLPDGVAAFVLNVLVDLASQLDLPTIVEGGGLKGLFKSGLAGFSLSMFAEVIMPLLADGGTPTGGCGGHRGHGLAILELGKFTDIEAGQALLGVDEHG